MPGRYYVDANKDGYRFGFNGKENDNDVKGNGNQLDYGMRIYDPRLGKFLTLDPLTKAYPMLTPYQFASNSPIAGIDLDGLEFYYAADGKFLGRIGTSQEVCTATKIETQAIKHPDGNTSTAQVPINPKSLNINHSEFIKFAGTAYGESSVGNGVKNEKEVYAFSSAMKNFKTLTGKSSVAYATTDGNPTYNAFVNSSDEGRNGTFMQVGIAAAINALSGGTDYSNGATHWAGNDIGSKAEKWAEGFTFTSKDHDFFRLGDNKKPGTTYWQDKSGKNIGLRGKFDFKWESTAAFGGTNSKGKFSGTTFMKVTSDYKKATGNKGQ